jgi:hypothetical protein
MNEERRLSKTEASLGLSLIASLLIALGGAYVYQFDKPTPITSTDPNWVSAQPAAPSSNAVEQTAYRPEWLPQQGDDSPPRTFAR